MGSDDKELAKFDSFMGPLVLDVRRAEQRSEAEKKYCRMRDGSSGFCRLFKLSPRECDREVTESTDLAQECSAYGNHVRFIRNCSERETRTVTVKSPVCGYADMEADVTYCKFQDKPCDDCGVRPKHTDSYCAMMND
ncbi:MAG: hypothetical protein V1887_02770 [Candidatus Aenigmatarchaeota archaeon]